MFGRTGSAPIPGHVWVHGTRLSAASFEPNVAITRALESNHTGMKYCFHYDEQLGVCRSGSSCVHAHRRPWVLINAPSDLHRSDHRIVFEPTLDRTEFRAIFVDDTWCSVETKAAKSGKGKHASKGKPQQQQYACEFHPYVAMVERACRQSGHGCFKVLEMGGGPFAWLKQHKFALPSTIQVHVRCGLKTQQFRATHYTVDQRGIQLVHLPDSKGTCFALRLSGASCKVSVVPAGYEVATEHAPALTVIAGTSESRCTAIQHFDHPLAPLVSSTLDLSDDRSAHTWSVSFRVPAAVPWAPVLLGATIHHGKPDTPAAPAISAGGVRSIIVTPTTHRHNDPAAHREATIQQPNENRSHFYRTLGRDAFVEVCMREEDGSDLHKSPPEIVERWTRVLSSPLAVNGVTYRFLTLGSNPRLAYFVDCTKADACVRALGVDPQVFHNMSVHKRLKRLRLGLSETFRVDSAPGCAFSVARVPDISAENADHLITDGSGVMSSAMKSHIESLLRQQCAAIVEGSDCSGVQYRMGAFKGTLVAARGALSSGKDFEIFQSCEKVPCTIDGSTPLNVIATSKWSAGARLDKYVMAVLIEGGLPLHTLMALGLETYANRAAATNVAHETELCRRDKIALWMREVVEDSKKHLQIDSLMGATLMGFIDPSGDLKPTAKDPADAKSTLPCVFVAPPSEPKHQQAYAQLVAAGKAVITRSPTYALGDVRVVRVLTAKDVPALDHLRDMLVFPRQGPTSLPALMSGGDLDGDEFKLVWDERVLCSFRTIEEPTSAPDDGASADRASAPKKMSDAEFAGQCLNERSLLGTLHRAQLGWLLADPHGAQAKRCAALCMQEVDGRAAGKFINPASVKDLTRPPSFIATIGRPTPMARHVENHVDVYVAAPRLSIEQWWTAVAAVEQDGVPPLPEDEFLAAVGFPAQQGLGRLARLQWYSAAGLHQTRVEHMPVSTIVDAAPGTPVTLVTPGPVRRAIAAAKRRSADFDPVSFAPPTDDPRSGRMAALVTDAAAKLSATKMLASLFPASTSTDDINVTVRASVGSSLFPCGGRMKPTDVGDLDVTLAMPKASRADAASPTHTEQTTPHAPRGNAAPAVQRGFEKYSPPKPLFLGRDGAWVKSRDATSAIAECETLLDHMARHLAVRFNVARSTIETSVKLRSVIRPHLPAVMSTLRQWSIDVVPGEAAPVAVRDLDTQQIKFGPAFCIRGRGPALPADTMRFGIRAVGSGLLEGDSELSKPIAHLELDDARNAFPVKLVGAGHPPVEIVMTRLVGQALLQLPEPTTGRPVALHVKLRTVFNPEFGNEIWSKSVWEVEPSVIVNARDPALVDAALAAMDTLLHASHYEGMLPSD